MTTPLRLLVRLGALALVAATSTGCGGSHDESTVARDGTSQAPTSQAQTPSSGGTTIDVSPEGIEPSCIDICRHLPPFDQPCEGATFHTQQELGVINHVWLPSKNSGYEVRKSWQCGPGITVLFDGLKIIYRATSVQDTAGALQGFKDSQGYGEVRTLLGRPTLVANARDENNVARDDPEVLGLVEFFVGNVDVTGLARHDVPIGDLVDLMASLDVPSQGKAG